ncbi:hypothetical protein ACTNDG_00910 [Clostridium sp. HCP1S3_B4]|uniref:hypothetical protein n=2 Tax=Clostridium TaxID=1485 RepID=UPI003F88BBAB
MTKHPICDYWWGEWGMFWRDEIKDNVKKKIADEFIKLSDKYDNSEFYSKQGNIIYGVDCNVHRIDGYFVAKHPGDKGMEVIASEILKLLYF